MLLIGISSVSVWIFWLLSVWTAFDAMEKWFAACVYYKNHIIKEFNKTNHINNKIHLFSIKVLTTCKFILIFISWKCEFS